MFSTPSYKFTFNIFAMIFLKLSAADLLHVGKARTNLCRCPGSLMFHKHILFNKKKGELELFETVAGVCLIIACVLTRSTAELGLLESSI